MNEEYLRGLHEHLGVEDDYDTWVYSVKDDDVYLRGLHGHIGVEDDYDTWFDSVWLTGQLTEEMMGEAEKKKDGESLSQGGVSADVAEIPQPPNF